MSTLYICFRGEIRKKYLPDTLLFRAVLVSSGDGTGPSWDVFICVHFNDNKTMLNRKKICDNKKIKNMKIYKMSFRLFSPSIQYFPTLRIRTPLLLSDGPFDFMCVCVCVCVWRGGGGGGEGSGVSGLDFFSSATRACLFIHVFAKRTIAFTLVLAYSLAQRIANSILS